MEIVSTMPEAAVAEILGGKIERFRLSLNMKQEDLAREAGVGKATVSRLEKGSVGTSLGNLIKVLSILGIVENFNALVPNTEEGPIYRLKHQDKRRRRARDTRPSEEPKTWTWGDETK